MSKVSSHTPAPSSPMRTQLTEFNHYHDLIAAARVNHRLGIKKLASKVLEGRDQQVELSAKIQDARLKGNDASQKRQTKLRRLVHIQTILARAELLARPEAPSLSQYTGDEGRFDDLSVLERAKSFMLTEASETMTGDERLNLMTFAERFAGAEDRVEHADY